MHTFSSIRFDHVFVELSIHNRYNRAPEHSLFIQSVHSMHFHRVQINVCEIFEIIFHNFD